MGSLTCAKCGQEVRWGRRHDRLAYWHREDVDHFAAFGKLLQPGEWEAISSAHHSRGDYDREGNESEAAQTEIPPVEVGCTPLPLAGKRAMYVEDGMEIREERIEIAGRRVVIPGGARALVNAVQKADGWEVRRFTYARGPFISAKSQSLGISDSFVVGFVSPVLDGGRWSGVASWRTPDEGDPQVLFGWRIAPDRTVDAIGVAALKTWIKETEHG